MVEYIFELGELYTVSVAGEFNYVVAVSIFNECPK